VSAVLYLEGGSAGPDSKDLQIRCREGFRKLLERCGYRGRMPRLFASGSRQSAFKDFEIAQASTAPGRYIAMWIDSEDPLSDPEETWQHLARRDGQTCPADATNDQVLFMTTCMETLIVADHAALNNHYGSKLQISALPPLHGLEDRNRHDVQDCLVKATGRCRNRYEKGRRSFQVLACLDPDVLVAHLPSFHRARRILDQRHKPAT